MNGSTSIPCAAARSARAPSTPVSRKSRHDVVPVCPMNRRVRRISVTRSARSAAARFRCFRLSGGATASSSESPTAASLVIESPTCVCALTNAGITMSVDAVSVCSTAWMRPPSTTTRPRIGSSDSPARTVPSICSILQHLVERRYGFSLSLDHDARHTSDRGRLADDVVSGGGDVVE